VKHYVVPFKDPALVITLVARIHSFEAAYNNTQAEARAAADAQTELLRARANQVSPFVFVPVLLWICPMSRP